MAPSGGCSRAISIACLVAARGVGGRLHGYQTVHSTLAGILSEDAAEGVGPCWAPCFGVQGDPRALQGEPRNMWKPTAVKNLWFHGGKLALSQFYSRFVARQLKARVVGLPVTVWGGPLAGA